MNRWRLEADVRPGDFAVVDRERTEGVLWTSAFFSEKNAYFVKAGSCVVVLSAPEGPRRLAVMVLCDGPYERMVPSGTLVLLLSNEMNMPKREYVDCLALVDGSVCWLQVISLSRTK